MTATDTRHLLPWLQARISAAAEGRLAVFVGPLRALRRLGKVELQPPPLLICPGPRARHLGRPTVLANPAEPPLAGGVAALVLVQMLARLPDPAAFLDRWNTVLQPLGRLLWLEPMGGIARTLQLRRSTRPEALTALLLNASFSEIGQQALGSLLLTSARADPPLRPVR